MRFMTQATKIFNKIETNWESTVQNCPKELFWDRFRQALSKSVEMLYKMRQLCENKLDLIWYCDDKKSKSEINWGYLNQIQMRQCESNRDKL